MKTSFADIYSEWTEKHDEDKAISRRNLSDDKKVKTVRTIGEIRRMKAQDELDLHNVLLEDALKQTNEFIAQSVSKGLFKVRIITGKGLHSPKGEAVIRPAVMEVLKNNPKIRELDTHPKAEEGGSGAITVIFKHT